MKNETGRQSSVDDKSYVISLYVPGEYQKNNFDCIKQIYTNYIWKRLRKDVKINISYQIKFGLISIYM